MNHTVKNSLSARQIKSRRATRERALTVARRILCEDGYAQLTMEGVAFESGVAKTTIYRHWPTKASLCMDLYLEAAKELEDPDLGDVARDLKHLAQEVVRLQTHTVAGPALVGLIAEAQINPDSRGAFLAEFAEKRRAVSRLILTRAIKKRQLLSGTDVDLVIDAIGGAITFRLLQGHAPLNRKFINCLIDLVLSGCGRGAQKNEERR